jgi:hypothetical protein
MAQKPATGARRRRRHQFVSSSRFIARTSRVDQELQLDRGNVPAGVPAPFVPACHTCLPPVHGDDVPWDRAGLKDERGLCAEPKCLTELTFRSARGSMLCVLPDCNDDAPRVARRETRVG